MLPFVTLSDCKGMLKGCSCVSVSWQCMESSHREVWVEQDLWRASSESRALDEAETLPSRGNPSGADSTPSLSGLLMV